MPMSEEDAASTRADMEKLQLEDERLREERPMGTSFHGRGDGGSVDRGGTAAPWTRGAHEIAKQGPAARAPAEPPNPHAFIVGRGFGSGVGGRGGHRRHNGVIFRDGGMPRQQQQQQHLSRGGGIPHERSSHTVPPARQPRQQQLPRGIPTVGVGGIYNCRSNAVYFQENSPPLPGAPMCAVYRCGRCGKHRHKSEHCAAPRRFEGTCGACGQYGHMWRNCALRSHQPHLNVLTSSGECYVTDAHGADTIVIPPQQHHQPAVDLGGEDIPFQQPSDTMHYSTGMSGGGRGDGDALGPDVPNGGEDSDDDDWNSSVARRQQLDLRHNGGVVETRGTLGRGSGGDRRD